LFYNNQEFISFLFSRHRIPIPSEEWWLKIRPLLRIMAHHESVYVSELINNDDESEIIKESGIQNEIIIEESN
jgi:hypothetical protein